MDYKLVKETDPVLTTPTLELSLEEIATWQETFDHLYDLMRSNNGIGLAAPQVGLSKRFFIMNYEGRCKVFINPVITNTDENLESMDEGCLSFRGLYLKVKRSPSIEVKYVDRHGNTMHERLEGVYAQCFQHELEHLDGIVFTTKVAKLSLAKARDKRAGNLKKLNRQ